MIIVTFLDALATVDVLTASNSNVKLVKTRAVDFAGLLIAVSFSRENKQTRPRFSSFVRDYLLLCPEISRDITLIPSILKCVQRCQVS